MKNILFGITGGIAAYKSVELINILRKKHYATKIIVTANALKFVTSLTLQTMSKNKIYKDELAIDDYCLEHIELSKWADIFLIAPLTANTLAKIANGIADNLLTSTVLAMPVAKPLLLAPAMNTNIWNNPATQANLKKVATYYPKVTIINPRESVLACGDNGYGAMEDIEIITQIIEANNA